MELMGIGVQHIGLSLRLSFSRCLGFGLGCRNCLSWLGCRGFCRSPNQLAVTGSIVDAHAGLDIVALHAEQDAIALVLHGLRFHDHAGCYEVVPIKHRGHTV